MNPSGWKQAWDLFAAVAELPEHEQEAFLLSAGVGAEVLDEVRELLRDTEQADGGRQTAAPDHQTAAGVMEDSPSQIGPYRLLQTIGEGAMGVVYLAEQTAPFRRIVAIKVVRQGMRTREVLERFSIERRALALMDHPNIARVFDAGQTEGGQPYFAMEFVPGVPITTYCEQQRLTVRAKLELLVPVCNAIQHAHQKGIVHRDIKPRNVMVTEVDGKPVVKVIDFGVARAVESGGAADSMATQFGSVVGTIAYMSPEQASLNHALVDTRSDIYSTGVLAYELLTGSTPLAGVTESAKTGLGLLAALEQVQSQEAEAPSRRAPGAHLEVEIDWIVMKAIEKEPARRYQTVNAFGRDIQRFLDGDPVEAGRPSRAYRMKKTVHRHRWLLATVSAFMLVLVVATLISVRQAIRATNAEQAAVEERDRARMAEHAARREAFRAQSAEERIRQEQEIVFQEKQRADSEAAISRTVGDFLQNDLLAQASPNVQAGPSTSPDPNLTIREVLDRASNRVNEKLANQPPAVRAAIEHTLGSTYLELGLFEKARTHAERAVELRRRSLGPAHADTLSSLDRQAAALQGLARYPEAAAIWDGVLARQRASHGDRHPQTLSTLRRIAMLYRAQGKYPQAEELLGRVLQVRRKDLGEGNQDTLRAAGDLAAVYLTMGKHSEAEKLQRPTYEARRRLLGEEHPETLASLHDLAVAIHYLSRVAEAEPLYRKALETQRRVLGPHHAQTRTTMNGLGSCLNRLGKLDEALKLRLEHVELEKRFSGERHPSTLNALHNLGAVYDSLGEYGRAAEFFSKALTLQREVLGPENPAVLLTMYNLAGAVRKTGQYERAATLLEQVIEVRKRVLGTGHPAVQMARSGLALAYSDLGRHREAAEIAQDAYEARRRRFGENHFQTADAGTALALAVTGLGRFADARQAGERALAARLLLGSDHPDTLETIESVGLIHLRSGNAGEAAKRLRGALDARVLRFGPQRHRPRLRTALTLALAYWRLGQAAEAERLLEDLASGQEAGQQPREWERSVAVGLLGVILAAQQRFDEAAPLLAEGYARTTSEWGQVPGLLRQEITGVWQTLPGVFRAAGREMDSSQWQVLAAGLQRD